ncbi:hypothetical protein HGM15179_012109 [Zosterops borbonicus]|uniref:Rna-directed dna polymerase from mobile element jockey-like n=1 Tax=Zosterops borbonicus TaxID=364589 RepID=A0A8K1GBJ8_9PASS|nr:hypothetical protein HGM15179_012109 [Zosterops borbonicus]
MVTCHFDNHDSIGLDEIHPRVVTQLSGRLTKPLSIVYHQSWLTGKVPDEWRLDNVIPTNKKFGKEEPGNYRPVSLVLVPGKIMDHLKCVTYQFCYHFNYEY